MIFIILSGLSMAVADSIPGVSGSTIAFILGFYEKFIGSLHALMSSDKKERNEAFFYLVKFAIGWAAGMVTSILILSKVFEEQVYFMSSIFFGLTLAAIPFIALSEKETIKGKYSGLIFTFIGAALVAGLTYYRATSSSSSVVNFSSLSTGQFIYLMVTGLLAISAMLLPGISGSSLLLIFGVYVPTVNAVKELIHLHLNYLPGVIAIGIGAVLGMVFIVKQIKKVLANARDKMIYLVLGLMLGSLYAIIMGATTLSVPKPAMSFETFSFVGCLIGVGVLVALEMIRKYK